jgi:hypothetical protein
VLEVGAGQRDRLAEELEERREGTQVVARADDEHVAPPVHHELLQQLAVAAHELRLVGDRGVRAVPLAELALLAADPEAAAVEELHEAGEREPPHVQRLSAQKLEHAHPLRMRAGGDLGVEAGGAAAERVEGAAEELVAHLAAKQCGRSTALGQQQQPLELVHLVLLRRRFVLAEHPLDAEHHLGEGGAGAAGGGALTVRGSRTVGPHPGRGV